MARFKPAVEAIPELRIHLRQGLQALGADSLKVAPRNSRDLTGSVNLDHALQASFPSERRWDYAIGVRSIGDNSTDKVFFVEVHKATASEVPVVIGKQQWIRQWLKSTKPAAALNQLPSRFVWVASGKDYLPPGGPHRKQLAQHGIQFESRRLEI